MKKQLVMSLMCAGLVFAAAPALRAQDPAAPAAAPAVAAPAPAEAAPAAAGAIEESQSQKQTNSGSFWHVITSSGWLGIVLWMAIFGAFGFYIYLLIDCSIVVRVAKIMPQKLIDDVEAAMKEGDVVKALQCCDSEPGPMANILSAGFSHVEEGYDVIQEAIGTAADIEVERIMQKLTWFSVDGNIAPMLGLLGTVQGMIMAFGNLASGTPDVSLLAMNIAQALWTTAWGLVVAIPCVATYYLFRNNANRIVLRMEAITMELVKDLRNVQVVNE
jgi:biopolymer transport protein ExbB